MRFEVAGTVRSTEEAIEVTVDVRNVGDQPAPSLGVVGELFGRRDEARVAEGVPAGRSVRVMLRFPPGLPRPGIHALELRLQYPEGPAADATGNLPVASDPAFLLLALGENVPPAVRVTASEVELDALGHVSLAVESADGTPHRVRVHALTPRGLHADGPPLELDVPGQGTARASLALRRAGALRGPQKGVILVAEAVDGPVARTTVVSTAVTVVGEPGRLPRLRIPLFVLGGLLIGAALFREFRRTRASSVAT